MRRPPICALADSAARRSLATLAAWCFGTTLATGALAQGSATVEITGNLGRPLSLTVADLQRYPAHEVTIRPERAGDRPGAGSPVARRYVGCLLRDVLAAARPTESKPRELRRSHLVVTGGDGYEVVFSWAELFVNPVGDSVYIAYQRDGAAIAEGEGPITLVVATDLRPVRHVKWLRSVRLRAD